MFVFKIFATIESAGLFGRVDQLDRVINKVLGHMPHWLCAKPFNRKVHFATNVDQSRSNWYTGRNLSLEIPCCIRGLNRLCRIGLVTSTTLDGGFKASPVDCNTKSRK